MRTKGPATAARHAVQVMTGKRSETGALFWWALTALVLLTDGCGVLS